MLLRIPLRPSRATHTIGIYAAAGGLVLAGLSFGAPADLARSIKRFASCLKLAASAAESDHEEGRTST